MSLFLAASMAAAVSLSPCHVSGAAQAVECGTLTVPAQRPATADGRTLELHFIRIPAAESGNAPILFLPGGPGQAGSDIVAVARAILGPSSRAHDLLIPDFRGTGKSGALTCSFATDLVQTDIDASVRETAKCRDALEAEGIVLADYNSSAIADDMAQLVRALGYEQVNLYGGSYGTRAAQVIMRRHPELVRSAVMDGVAPLGWTVGGRMGADAQAALEAVAAACAKQASCAEAFPNIEAQLRRVLAQAERNGATTRQLPDPRTGEPEPVTIDSLMLTGAVRGVLYNAPLTRLLPWMIAQADAGNVVPLHTAAQEFAGDMSETISLGMMLSVLCSEDVGRLQGAVPAAERNSFAGSAIRDYWQAGCGEWPVPRATSEFDTPVTTDIPSLLLSGVWDPVTPPRNGEMLAETLPNARHIAVQGTAHIAGYRGCMPRLVAQFYDNPDPAALETDCLDVLKTPAFMTTGLAPGATTEAAQ